MEYVVRKVKNKELYRVWQDMYHGKTAPAYQPKISTEDYRFTPEYQSYSINEFDTRKEAVALAKKLNKEIPEKRKPQYKQKDKKGKAIPDLFKKLLKQFTIFEKQEDKNKEYMKIYEDVEKAINKMANKGLYDGREEDIKYLMSLLTGELQAPAPAPAPAEKTKINNDFIIFMKKIYKEAKELIESNKDKLENIPIEDDISFTNEYEFRLYVLNLLDEKIQFYKKNEITDEALAVFTESLPKVHLQQIQKLLKKASAPVPAPAPAPALVPVPKPAPKKASPFSVRKKKNEKWYNVYNENTGRKLFSYDTKAAAISKVKELEMPKIFSVRKKRNEKWYNIYDENTGRKLFSYDTKAAAISKVKELEMPKIFSVRKKRNEKWYNIYDENTGRKLFSYDTKAAALSKVKELEKL